MKFGELKLRRIILAVGYILIVSCESRTNKNDSALDSSVISQIDSIGEAFLDRGGVKGIAVTVAKEGKVVYSRGFGYIDSMNTKPVKAENVFLMASITKLVCAAMVLKLVEEQKLNLDQTLSELLPDFPNREQAERINLRHLLAHTSGLRDYAEVIDSVFVVTGINPTKADFYDFFETNKLDFDPGQDYNYSNSGFLLTAMIIERVTGNSFGAELDRIINQPTGLDLKLIKDRVTDGRITSVFEFKDSSLVYQPHWTWIKGDGGLTATSNHLALFPFYWSNGTIISEESFEEMCTPTKLNDGITTGYGLGVRTGYFEGEYCVGHTGGNKTSIAVMKFYPDLQTSVVIMVNTDNSPADAQIIEGFLSLAVLKKPQPELDKTEIKDFDTSPYIGNYTSSSNMYYGTGDLSIVTHENDHHLYRKQAGPEPNDQKLYYLGSHTFAYESFPMDRIVFEADSSGRIAAFNTYWNGLRKGRLFKKTEL